VGHGWDVVDPSGRFGVCLAQSQGFCVLDTTVCVVRYRFDVAEKTLTGLAVNGTGTTFATGQGDGAVTLWDLRAPGSGEVSVPQNETASVLCLAFSETCLATLHVDGLISVRDKRKLQSPVQIQRSSGDGLKGWGSLQYDQTGKYLAAGGPSIQVFDSGDNYRVVRTLTGHRASVNGLHWGESATELISSSTDGVVVVWGVRQ
jgi:WD40 repeat protein